MNIPNRISTNTRLDSGNRHRLSTKPFIDPSIDEMAAAGAASSNDRQSGACNRSHAVFQPSVVHSHGQPPGSDQAAEAEIAPFSLKLVITRTYTGMRMSARKPSSRTNRTAEPSWRRVPGRVDVRGGAAW